jgi:hypothetical protein
MSNLPEMLCVYEELSLEGYLVYLPVLLGASGYERTIFQEIIFSVPRKANIDEVLKEKLQQLHFKKIEESDFIFVVNPKPRRYIGEGTKAEVKYAKDHLTPVKYLEDPGLELDLLESVWKRDKEESDG